MNSASIFAAAQGYLGIQEWPGAKHNPEVLSFAKAAGLSWIIDDETPWCATFVGAVLAQVNLPNTGAANARSYLKWGVKVAIEDAQFGDVLVFWRGTKSGWQGHVGFFAGWDSANLRVLGGNQGNAVSVKTYPIDRLLEVRRTKAPRSNPVQSTTVQASSGISAAGAAGSAIAAASSLDGTAQIVLVAGGILVTLLGIYILRERLKSWFGKGSR